MRTTLTLDDDVAAEIERLRRDRDANLKDLVNEALRRGLRDMRAPPKKREPFHTRPIHGSISVLENMDNIADVLAIIEGEMFK
jgi:hypothetical protein